MGREGDAAGGGDEDDDDNGCRYQAIGDGLYNIQV